MFAIIFHIFVCVLWNGYVISLVLEFAMNNFKITKKCIFEIVYMSLLFAFLFFIVVPSFYVTFS